MLRYLLFAFFCSAVCLLGQQTESAPVFQMVLFDFGVDLAHLRATRERIMGAERTANTLKAYALGWNQFFAWCTDAGRDPLPASSDTIQLFITALIDRGRRLKTVESYLCGITRKHLSSSFPSPMDDQIRMLLRNARRDLQEKPAGKAALTPHQLRKICRRRSDRPIDLRDRAMFVLCFASGWRGAELVSLDLADIRFRRQGVVLYLGKSKTDQEGTGRAVGVHRGKRASTCPVQALRDWIKARGDWPGPLFVRTTKSGNVTEDRITRETVSNRLQAALQAIGADPKRFGSHSLRIGMVTAATESGRTAQQIKGRTGHKTTKTLERYIRPAQVFRVDPLKGIL